MTLMSSSLRLGVRLCLVKPRDHLVKATRGKKKLGKKQGAAREKKIGLEV